MALFQILNRRQVQPVMRCGTSFASCAVLLAFTISAFFSFCLIVTDNPLWCDDPFTLNRWAGQNNHHVWGKSVCVYVCVCVTDVWSDYRWPTSLLCESGCRHAAQCPSSSLCSSSSSVLLEFFFLFFFFFLSNLCPIQLGLLILWS